MFNGKYLAKDPQSVKIMKKLILVTLGSLCHIKSCCWLSDIDSLLTANVCDVQTI